MKLKQSDITYWRHAKSQYYQREEKILKRITEIIYVIHDHFEIEYPETWYFHDAQPSECGTLVLDYDHIEGIVLEPYNQVLSLDKIDFNEGFPMSFLFMSNRDIKKELAKL